MNVIVFSLSFSDILLLAYTVLRGGCAIAQSTPGMHKGSSFSTCLLTFDVSCVGVVCSSHPSGYKMSSQFSHTPSDQL